VAAELDLDEDEIKRQSKFGNSHMSLDAPLQQGEDSRLIVVLLDEFRSCG
jgi:DNA-directed RNA polymerase sigma subunit (sigma70/sigma32)